MNKLFLSFIFALFMGINCIQAQKTMKIIYVYDALCGWCYGFSPVMEQFAAKHSAEAEFVVISGGMVVGERIGAIGEVAPYISWAYKEVENRAGVKFGQKFLDEVLKEGKTVFTSIPAAWALSAFKTYQPQNSVAFAARLQKGVYWDGAAPLDYQHYGKMAAEFGINAEEFVQKMQTEEIQNLANQDFNYSNQLGVQGFPAVFLEKNGQYVFFANGYMDLASLEKQFEQAILMIK